MSRRLALGSMVALGWICTQGCDGEPPTEPDAGPRVDAGGDAMDGGVDAGESTPDAGSCIRVTEVQAWRLDNRDDTGVRIRARFRPDIDEQPWDLYLWFQRFGDAPWEGTIPLGEGINDNFPDCAHCVVALYGATTDHGFFADSGTMELRADPFGPRMELSLHDVRMIEVTIAAEDGVIRSTPVENGRCLQLPETVEVAQVFPPPEWRCDRAQYADGERCDCACGAWDPDCFECAGAELGTECDEEPLPVAGCAASEVCSLEAECVEGCGDDDPCASGYCTYWFDGQRICLDDTDRIDPAGVGETCAPSFGPTRLCAAYDGVIHGVCIDRSLSEEGAPAECLPTCETDADCDDATYEICHSIFGYDIESSPGYCAPRQPLEWTCHPTAYEDGATCDCACGVWDPDCGYDVPFTDADRLNGCAAGEVCILSEDYIFHGPSECVAAPPNDTCATAAPLPVDATVEVSNLGAADDYHALGCFMYERAGQELAYRVELAAGDVLTVRATPVTASYDVALYLLGPGDAALCDDPAVPCAAFADDHRRGLPEELSFTAAAAGTYYVLVDSFAFEWSTFQLTASIE